MKKIKILATTLAIISMQNATAAAGVNVASNSFVWHGQVPVAVMTNGFIITGPGGAPITQGELAFSLNGAGDEGILLSSSTIDFNVFPFNGTTTDIDDPATYNYELTSFKVSNEDGILNEQLSTGYYDVYANASKLNKATKSSDTDGVTRLSIHAGSGTTNRPAPGQYVSLHATILITNIH